MSPRRLLSIVCMLKGHDFGFLGILFGHTVEKCRRCHELRPAWAASAEWRGIDRDGRLVALVEATRDPGAA
jgi:hypothetical protein